jgi:RimJ/RimL family protein N-acetyltransferase
MSKERRFPITIERIDDNEALRALYDEVAPCDMRYFGVHRETLQAWVAKAIRTDSSYVYVVRGPEGVLIGLSTGSVHTDDYGRRVAEIGIRVLAPATQGYGISSEVLATEKAYLASQGVSLIQVTASTKAGHGFLTSHGFSPQGRWRNRDVEMTLGVDA